MLVMSLIIGPAGPLSEYWYLKDYWQPEIIFGWKVGIEDFLFAFFIGGIGAVVYEVFLGKHLKRDKRYKSGKWMFFVLPVIGLAVLISLNSLLRINSIYASSLGFSVCAVIIWAIRPDLIKDSLLSGIFAGLLIFIFYSVFFLKIYPNIVNDWWMLSNISGIIILGIPLEEILWVFCWGLIAGPLYEFWQGYRLIGKRQ